MHCVNKFCPIGALCPVGNSVHCFNYDNSKKAIILDELLELDGTRSVLYADEILVRSEHFARMETVYNFQTMLTRKL